MRLDSPVVAFPSWVGVGSLPLGRRSGEARKGKPCLRVDNADSRLTQRRCALGLTQEWVAAHLGVHSRTIWRLERRKPYARVDVRVRRLRARVTALYRYIERGGLLP